MTANLNKMLTEKVYGEYQANKIELGFHVGSTWQDDPKHFLFALSRYKFVSKMLDGYKNVLEIGCGDGFCSQLVKSTVEKLSLTDIEEININQLAANQFHSVFVHDFIKDTIVSNYDAIYLLDVLEHIDVKDEDKFLKNTIHSLTHDGVMIVGMPTIESQLYASAKSKMNHVNCKTKSELKTLFKKYFHTVFMFSMNDEVLHTGFDAMSHYIFAVCSNKK